MVTPRKHQTLAASDVGEASWKDGLLTLQRRGCRSKEAIRLAAGEVGDLALALVVTRQIAGIDAGSA